MQPDRAPEDAPAATPNEQGSSSDSTIGYTTERSLWRAATVVEDEAGPDSSSIDLELAERPFGEAGGRYQIREVLGAGGMGEVRLCRDDAIGRDVAQKTLLDHRRTRQAERRFLREARVQGQLEHPSIVPVYDLGKAPDGGLFFTMRRVCGHTLAEVLEALANGEPAMVASYSRRKLLSAFARVCLAVDYAHSRGVLHRDLKPSNIMLGDFGEVYVLDWGIARLVAERATTAPVVVPPADLAGQGSMAGTPGYMSPEQMLGLGESQDARTDVYSLGAILFEILTLRRMHQHQQGPSLAFSSPETAQAVSHLPAPVRASTVASDVPPELDEVCARAAAIDRADRYASARELCDAVERYLDGDRDLERRRELSAVHAAGATAAFARVAAPDAGEEASASARADAMREVSAALALDAKNAEARELLVRLLVEVPSRMPPEVEAEIKAATQRNRAHFLRLATWGLASWMLIAPVVMAMGVRSWPPILLTTALSVCSFLIASWIHHTGKRSAASHLALSAVVFATVASVTSYMGPFVVIPQFASIVTLYIGLQCTTARERFAVLSMGALTVGIPFLLEMLRLVPPAYGFEGGNLVLFARTAPFSATGTIPLLLYVSVTTVLLPAVLLGRIRVALSAAESKLFLQAWHLQQLVPARAK